MIADYLKSKTDIKDEEFDSIYPLNVIKMSKRHFTEVDVAITAAHLLVTKPNQKILDIGSGVGKFCFVAGSCSDANYIGVDYRKHFVELCKELTIKHNFKNVDFIHEDILNIDFNKYDSFYFFNSFEEHSDKTAQLDTTVDVNFEKFKIYSAYVRKQFEGLPQGTRIVTYYADRTQIPDSYRIVSLHFEGLLKCWEKV